MKGLCACGAILAVVAVPARPAAAGAASTWISEDTFALTPSWWSIELEERVAIGSLQSDIFSSSTTVNFGVGLVATYHVDHHWQLGLGLAFDFPLPVGETASTYAAVDTSVPGLDTTVAVRVGYLPLALSWMTLGIAVEAGVLIDAITVQSGGSEADALAALGAFTGQAQLAFFPHDAFEIGVRAGYRYLVGERAMLGQSDADRLHVPAGPYRGLGDAMVVVYESLHF